MGKIVPALINYLHNLILYGCDREEGVVLEKIDSGMIIEWEENLDIRLEALEVAKFYGCGIAVKQKEEEEHYKFLTHGLLHKIRSTAYFHKQGLESRKIIMFSDDCISSIQLFVRDEAITLIVYMRSSDVMRLLPVDVLAMARLLNKVIDEYKLSIDDRKVVLDIHIGSAHIVNDEDLDKARKICEKEYGLTESDY